MRISSSTVCYTLFPHKNISASTLAPPIVFCWPRERQSQPRGDKIPAEGNRSRARSLCTPSAPELSGLSKVLGAAPRQAGRETITQQGNPQVWLCLQSHPLELQAQPMQQGLCRNKAVRRDKNPTHATLLKARVLLKGAQRISQLS